MTTPRKHKHAALIRAWLDDGSLVVERKSGAGDWYRESVALWHEDCEYRFKPKMIKCGDLEFPDPMRVAPAIGTEYWMPALDPNHLGSVIDRIWQPSSDCYQRLQRGICHTTQAAAKDHARALIALTESKP